jgi:peptidoglycan/LPS O-acetylase OafA/YrhL
MVLHLVTVVVVSVLVFLYVETPARRRIARAAPQAG